MVDGRTILVTGAAGFIGAALCQRLLLQGDRVIGLDNLNDYYDPGLKQARLRQIEAVASADTWRFERLALEDGDALMSIFASEKPAVVVNPLSPGFVTHWRTRRHTSKAIWWFCHLLEGCRHHGTQNLVYAEQPVWGEPQLPTSGSL